MRSRPEVLHLHLTGRSEDLTTVSDTAVTVGKQTLGTEVKKRYRNQVQVSAKWLQQFRSVRPHLFMESVLGTKCVSFYQKFLFQTLLALITTRTSAI
jgi:hypothetical protein